MEKIEHHWHGGRHHAQAIACFKLQLRRIELEQYTHKKDGLKNQHIFSL